MNNEQPIKRTYTVEEVATILGVSIRKAYDLCEKTKDFNEASMRGQSASYILTHSPFPL